MTSNDSSKISPNGHPTVTFAEAAKTEPNLVQLFVYDLSRGLAKSFSTILLGKIFIIRKEINYCMANCLIFQYLIAGQQLEGIWHTSVVVYGEEFFFGSGGVVSCPPVRIYLIDF